MCTTVAPLGILCHTGLCCGSQASQQGKNIVCFPPLEAFMGVLWYHKDKTKALWILPDDYFLQEPDDIFPSYTFKITNGNR